MMLEAENISKQYRLGLVGTGTLSDDFKRWWFRLKGKEDPFLKVGSVNDRSSEASEDYVWALQDINFNVNEGEVLGIIGKNGAGKSTLLKILSRVTSPTTGAIRTKGRIASLLEVGTGFHAELTGRENIFMNGAVLGMTKLEIRNKLDEIIAFSGCERYIDTPVKRYSSGMIVRLGFAVAAHLEPEILVVDEVLAVGDAEFQKKAIGKMQDLSTGEGRTVLFVSHNMRAIKSLCSRSIVLENGKILFNGDTYAGVENYLKFSRSIPKGISRVSNRNRRYNTEKSIEFIAVSSSEEYPFRENIYLILKLKKNVELDAQICITGTICNLDDESVGSFFSPLFTLNQNLETCRLEIKNHNLSPGEYYLNLSISKGNLENGNLSVLDHAYEIISFDVSNSLIDDFTYFNWDKSWGKLYFESSLIKIGNTFG